MEARIGIIHGHALIILKRLLLSSRLKQVLVSGVRRHLLHLRLLHHRRPVIVLMLRVLHLHLIDWLLLDTHLLPHMIHLMVHMLHLLVHLLHFNLELILLLHLGHLHLLLVLLLLLEG